MLKHEGLFRVGGNNWRLPCPFDEGACRRAYCDLCEIYDDWQKLGEIIVICAWCSKVKDRKPNFRKAVVSYETCPECEQKYFPETTRHKVLSAVSKYL